jgi:hypothetical protein
MPQAVPTLDDLACDPHLASGLPAEVLAALALRTAAVLAAIAAAQTAPVANAMDASAPAAQQADELLTVEAAASVLSVPQQWLYRRCKRLGLAIVLGPGTLRISRSRLDAFMRGQAVTSTGAVRRKRALDRELAK